MRIKRTHIVLSTISVVVTIVAGEIFARYYLGLGTPPLSITHPIIEYMYKPNQDVYRFGNHFFTNQYGMRTIPFNAEKGNNEYRIMVFGDSVLNGGNLTDHSELATSILQNTLDDPALKQDIIVGNISAGSWGPGNWLTYAEEYGFFGADAIVLVISSHDYVDIPTFQPLNENTHPTEMPLSALIEGITRYLPRYLPQLGTGEAGNEPDRFDEKINEQHALKGLRDLRSFIELAKNNATTNILVLQHLEKAEIEKGSPNPGYQRIKEVCESLRIMCVSIEPYFLESMEKGANPYRDNIHPNQIGQQLIANAILKNIPISWLR